MVKQLALIEWDDAWADQDNFATAHGIAVTHAPLQVRTLGWIIQDDEVGISVANEQGSTDGQDVFRGRTFIPRAMIRSVTPYTLTKPRTPKKEVHVEPTD